MKKKKIVLYITILNLIIYSISNLFVVPVKASTVDMYIQNLRDAERLQQEVAQYFANNMPVPDDKRDELFKKYCTFPGFLVGGVWFTAANIYDSFWGQILPSGDSIDGQTAQDVSNQVTEKLINDTTITDTTIEFGPDAKALLKKYIDTVRNSSGYVYVYSNRIEQHATEFTSGDKYNAVKTFCESIGDNYMVALWLNRNCIFAVPMNNNSIVRDGNFGTNTVYGKIYNNSNWTQLYWQTNYCYVYNSTSKQFEKGTYGDNVYRAEFAVNNYNTGTINNGVYVISYGKHNIFKMFQTVSDMQNASVGTSPYYTTNYFGDFNTSNVNNSYTVSGNNYNPVTYNDISGFNETYYNEHEDYPTPTEIQIYIDTYTPPEPTPTPTPTPNPDDPSGGGGSDESGDTGIFDFLSRLGEVLGNLIKNLGEMLTSLIDGIVETVSSVLESIPNIFTPLIDYVFGGLPPEVRAMIILGISCMVIIGIVKAFKG